MLTKIEYVAMTTTGEIHRKFKDEQEMNFWFYGLKGTTLEHSFNGAKITTIIEVLR